ncbi:unnamed protein product [Ixodes persulcatus]
MLRAIGANPVPRVRHLAFPLGATVLGLAPVARLVGCGTTQGKTEQNVMARRITEGERSKRIKVIFKVPVLGFCCLPIPTFIGPIFPGLSDCTTKDQIKLFKILNIGLHPFSVKSWRGIKLWAQARDPGGHSWS